MTLLSPEQLAKSGDEIAHQTALFAKLAIESKIFPELELAFAIPNGGLRDKVTAARLKASGAKAGVWDIMLPFSRGNWHGMFLEMKVGYNKLSDKQKDFGLSMHREGYYTAVAYSWNEAWEKIQGYLILGIDKHRSI